MDYAARSTDTLTTVHTRSRTIVLELWDNAEYDGDTISILVNNTPVVTDFELTRHHRRVAVELYPGHNDVLIAANNEGRVHRVQGKLVLSVHTSARSNQLVQVACDP